MATTTTLDRLSEIEAIYQDLEYRRLDALYRGDRDAFAAVHVDNGYLERSLEAFEDLRPEVQSEVDVVILRVIHDGPECIAVENLLFGPTSSEDNDAAIEVIETVDGIWLISFVGTGWTCDGPHPFDS